MPKLNSFNITGILQMTWDLIAIWGIMIPVAGQCFYQIDLKHDKTFQKMLNVKEQIAGIEEYKKYNFLNDGNALYWLLMRPVTKYYDVDTIPIAERNSALLIRWDILSEKRSHLRHKLFNDSTRTLFWNDMVVLHQNDGLKYLLMPITRTLPFLQYYESIQYECRGFSRETVFLSIFDCSNLPAGPKNIDTIGNYCIYYTDDDPTCTRNQNFDLGYSVLSVLAAYDINGDKYFDILLQRKYTKSKLVGLREFAKQIDRQISSELWTMIYDPINHCFTPQQFVTDLKGVDTTLLENTLFRNRFDVSHRDITVPISIPKFKPTVLSRIENQLPKGTDIQFFSIIPYGQFHYQFVGVCKSNRLVFAEYYPQENNTGTINDSVIIKIDSTTITTGKIVIKDAITNQWVISQSLHDSATKLQSNELWFRFHYDPNSISVIDTLKNALTEKAKMKTSKKKTLSVDAYFSNRDIYIDTYESDSSATPIPKRSLKKNERGYYDSNKKRFVITDITSQYRPIDSLLTLWRSGKSTAKPNPKTLKALYDTTMVEVKDP